MTAFGQYGLTAWCGAYVFCTKDTSSDTSFNLAKDDYDNLFSIMPHILKNKLILSFFFVSISFHFKIIIPVITTFLQAIFFNVCFCVCCFCKVCTLYSI